MRVLEYGRRAGESPESSTQDLSLNTGPVTFTQAVVSGHPRVGTTVKAGAVPDGVLCDLQNRGNKNTQLFYKSINKAHAPPGAPNATLDSLLQKVPPTPGWRATGTNVGRKEPDRPGCAVQTTSLTVSGVSVHGCVSGMGVRSSRS